MSDSASPPFEGGCDCRKIRYRVTFTPLVIHCCHCTWCQRESGSAFALNAVIESQYITLLGDGSPEVINTPSASGTGQMIARCPDCRIAVWSNYGDNSDLLRFIRVGSLDQPDVLGGPDIHIFTSTKQKWVNLERSLVPVVPEFYDRNKIWRKDSLERIAPVSAEIKRRREERQQQQQ